MSYAINNEKEQLLARVTGSVVKHLSTKGLKTVKIPIPSAREQEQFTLIAEQVEKSKSELRQAIEKIDRVMKSLMQ